ncbi:MAG: hypothetical protein JSU68_10615 [Phycisphaerales bacterium]|nr:MAG: hypothetical protein JSU68_10615 [Phycisphaerales bacterium]
MKYKAVAVFWGSEVNLVLWVTLVGCLLAGGEGGPEPGGFVKGMAIGGAVFAAVLQHWAYYGIYKPHRAQHDRSTLL